MNHHLQLPADAERRVLLNDILLSYYPDWEGFLNSPYCPFGTRNKIIISKLMEGRSFKELEKLAYTSKEALDVFYDHIIVVLEKEETQHAYRSWNVENSGSKLMGYPQQSTSVC